MKTSLFSSIVCATTLSSCVVAPPPAQVNYTNRGDIYTAGGPARAAVGTLPCVPHEIGTVKISVDEWARYQHLQDQEDKKNAENAQFVKEHIRGW